MVELAGFELATPWSQTKGAQQPLNPTPKTTSEVKLSRLFNEYWNGRILARNFLGLNYFDWNSFMYDKI